MTPMVPTFKQSQVKQLVEFRERGFTLREAGEALGRNAKAIARYERLYERYGIEVFAK